MDNKLNEEIKKAIENNLSGQISKQLLERFRKLEEIEEDYNKKVEFSIKLINDIDILETELSELKQLKLTKEKLEAERKVFEEEKLKQHYEAKFEVLKAEEAEKRADMVMGFMDNLTRNTIFKKRIIDTENPGGTPIVDGQGTAHYPLNTLKDFTETKTEE